MAFDLEKVKRNPIVYTENFILKRFSYYKAKWNLGDNFSKLSKISKSHKRKLV